ncbi:PAS domain-containing protein, partial [Fibrobacterota bacterium]
MVVAESESQTWLFSALFHQSPLNIAVVDREYNILEANSKFKEYFGEWKNKKCYQVYKSGTSPCPDCKARATFKDKKVRIHEEEGYNAKGDPAHYLVHTSPVIDPDGTVTHIIKRSQNVTDVSHHHREHQILFERSPCYIAVLDRNFKVVRANEKLRETFGECRGKFCYEVLKKQNRVCENCPTEMSFQDGKEHTSTHIGIDKDGNETHYVVTTTPLTKGKGGSSLVMEILTDVTQIKILEKEKLEAERLAAVGQTVAGLAHSVKNILMGVEGGMYIVGSGIKKGDKERMEEGWDMLKRNIEKVTMLVKDFLGFAKGRKPSVKLVPPNSLIDEIIELYQGTAQSLGIELINCSESGIKPAPLDRDGIHTCLTNLISNAIDACEISSKPESKVKIRVREVAKVIIFEVSDDGCGIDYDIKHKVFTTFFTTK